MRVQCNGGLMYVVCADRRKVRQLRHMTYDICMYSHVCIYAAIYLPDGVDDAPTLCMIISNAPNTRVISFTTCCTPSIVARSA